MAGYSSIPFATLAGAASPNQTLFSQIYFSNNVTANLALIKASADAGAKAIVWTVDSPGGPDRQRAARFGVGSSNTKFTKNTWELYNIYRNATSLPIVLKGIQNVQDARTAVDHGVPAIVLSNHGGRNLDGSPSSLEVALEIHQNDPDIFNQIEVLADGGIRYGTDALRLLALGVKAVSDITGVALFFPRLLCGLCAWKALRRQSSSTIYLEHPRDSVSLMFKTRANWRGLEIGRIGTSVYVCECLRRGRCNKGGGADASKHHE